MIQYYRGPSRILWFLIGAVTANWLLKCRKDADPRIFGQCMRLQYHTPPPNSSSASDGAPFAPSVPNSYEQQQSWQQEKEYLANISRKATDAMTDLTEVTLESVLSAAEAPKAKLAEHRANCEQQQIIIGQQIQGSRDLPPPVQ